MTVLKFSAGLLVGLTCMSLFANECSSYDGYKHEKTTGTLPEGAPLPDVEIKQNDNITPKLAYEIAKKNLNNNCQIDATEYYERAISALRRTKGHYNKTLAKNIVLDYGRLLRAHLGAQKAIDLEKEFLLK